MSGTMGEHGMAVMLARGELAIEADPVGHGTDQRSGARAARRGTVDTVDARRHPRRRRTVCNELAQSTGLAVILDEASLPVLPQVAGACDLLGIDPLYVANEGKFVAIVPEREAEAGLAALRGCPGGQDAAIVGEVLAEPEGIVALRTAFGGSRIVDMLVGDPLPRIC
ncbi:hypothetical protein GS473_17445 [Rhodococcus hoagii]|nr:hypothetical protein [Prescottella equi]